MRFWHLLTVPLPVRTSLRSTDLSAGSFKRAGREKTCNTHAHARSAAMQMTCTEQHPATASKPSSAFSFPVVPALGTYCLCETMVILELTASIDSRWREMHKIKLKQHLHWIQLYKKNQKPSGGSSVSPRTASCAALDVSEQPATIS